MNIQDTICAPATIPGTGAITLIRVSGPETLGIAGRVVTFKGKDLEDTKANTVRFGNICSGSETIDEVLVSVFRAPHSYTGEDSVEISCHASAYICQRILERLCDEGCRMAEPGEFTRRAFVNGKMDLAQAESVADIISSSSKASLRLAMNQLKGGYSRELSELRSQMLHLTSLLELELDFSEEEVEFADRMQLKELLLKALDKVNSLADSFHLGNAIKNGIPVAIVGAPNTGKSTLLNALLGEDRAIVSDIAGTTRDTIEETITIDGILYRLIDTAGIRNTEEKIEKIGIERSFSAISKADVVIALLDLTADIQPLRMNASTIAGSLNEGQKAIVLLNKSDIADEAAIKAAGAAASELFPASARVLPFSSLNGSGMDELKTVLKEFCSMQLDSSATLVTNMRHYEALQNAASALTRASDALNSGITADLVSVDLNEAIYHLGTITGAISNDEVLGNIFKNFCIGK